VPTLTAFVLETLTHPFTLRLSFRYGATRVYPDGYATHIAGCVRDGLIRPTIDTSVLAPDPSHMATPAGAFIMEPRGGEAHPMFFDPRNFERAGAEVVVKPGLSGNELADLRGVVIHEATHALQDWDQVELDPRTAEGAAYLAGAMTRLLWGYRTFGPIVNPQCSGLSYSLYLAERLFREGEPGGAVPADDVHLLNGLVTTGNEGRYVYNGIRAQPARPGHHAHRGRRGAPS
jgi:hypothetical protein